LPGESQPEFDTKLNGLCDHFQPIGMIEEALVEKLMVDLWRYRRFLMAEGAEIRAGAEFVEWNQREHHRADAASFPQLHCNGGLIQRMANPEALAGCLHLLHQLRNEIQERGFKYERDDEILTKLYGEYDEEGRRQDWREGIRRSYRALCAAVTVSREGDRKGALESAESYRCSFLAQLDSEITRFERYKKEQATVLSSKLKLESLRRNVPDGPDLDRLLRYSASVSRDIERTLNQLERLQRARLSEAVSPIDLNVSTSME
jgi:hypothetical protein